MQLPMIKPPPPPRLYDGPCPRCGCRSWWRDHDGDRVCILCARYLDPVLPPRLAYLAHKHAGIKTIHQREPRHYGLAL